MATTPQDWTAQLPPSHTSGSIPSGNPLAKHFRAPAIQIKLPSQGRYWPLGALENSATGEYPVFPMTARDEMMFNNPDALMNGQGVVDVIQSCVPAIKNAWGMPSVDLDTVLISIRIASYGETMDFDSACPKCNEENTFGVDLRTFLDRKNSTEIYDQPRSYSGLQFKFKPQDYKTINDLGMETYHTQRLIQTVQNQDLEDEVKIQRVNDLFKKLTDYTMNIVVNSIASVTTDDGQEVSESAHIDEFVRNCDRKTFDFIQKTVNEFSNSLKTEDVNAKCAACGHDYAIPFTFDNANFFGSDS